MAKHTIVNFIDNPDSRKTLTLTLERADFVVKEVSSRDEVLELVNSGEVHAVFIESNQVNDDGMKNLLKLSHLPAQHIPLLVMTSHIDIKMKTKAADVGVTNWIAKPFHPTRLISGLNKLIAKSQLQANQTTEHLKVAM